MVDQSLFNYIRQQLSQGISQEEIVNVLLTQGWGRQEVDEAFSSLKSSEAPAAPAPTPPVTSESQRRPAPQRVRIVVLASAAAVVVLGIGAVAALQISRSRPLPLSSPSPLATGDLLRTEPRADLNVRSMKLADIVGEYKTEAGREVQYPDVVAIFSPDGSSVAYVVKRVGKESVVINGREGKAYDAIGDDTIVFSSGGRQLAYTAVEGGDSFPVVNGKEIRTHWTPYPVVFSPDERRFAYPAFGRAEHEEFARKIERGESFEPPKAFMIVDGQESPPYGAADSTVFSSDSTRVGYFAVKDIKAGKAIVVIDGQEYGPYERASAPLFSSDSAHVAYVAAEGGRWFVMLDGVRLNGSYDEIDIHSLVLSSDGKRVAFRAKEGPRWAVVVNDQKGREYDFIGDIAFSPDGKHVAYGAEDRMRSSEKYVLVLDGQEGKRYDAIRHIVFSPDGSRIMYVADRYDAGGLPRSFVVVDGREGKAYDYETHIYDLTFTTDSKHFAYRTQRSSYPPGTGQAVFRGSAVLDGQEVGVHDRVFAPFAFSHDGKYLVYGARVGTELWWFAQSVQ